MTIEEILAWADAYRAATGRWPIEESGPVAGAPALGETWRRIDQAPRRGHRGLSAGQSLDQLLRQACR